MAKSESNHIQNQKFFKNLDFPIWSNRKTNNKKELKNNGKRTTKKTFVKAGGLLFGIGLLFLIWMIGTMIEFAGELEALKLQLQNLYPTYYYGNYWEEAWNDP